MKRLVSLPLLGLFSLSALASATAQSARLTAADYDRAVRLLGPSVTPLMSRNAVTATWLTDDRLWYRVRTNGGSELVLVDPAKKTRTVCDATGSNCPGVPLNDSAAAGGRGGGRGGRGGGGGRGGAAGAVAMSPDGKRAAFIRDWNLWVRDVATGQEKQLTTDGAKDFGYATDNAGWAGSDRPILLWSPDSKKIATAQQDERKVGDMFLVETKVGHPTLRAWKYPLPGDSVVAMLHHVVIDVESGRTTRLQLPPQFHRGTIGDNITLADYNWSPDGSQLALATTTRDHKTSTLHVANPATGAVRKVFDETTATHFESRTGWRVLWGTNEVIWYSQRDDWG